MLGTRVRANYIEVLYETVICFSAVETVTANALENDYKHES